MLQLLAKTDFKTDTRFVLSLLAALVLSVNAFSAPAAVFDTAAPLTRDAVKDFVTLDKTPSVQPAVSTGAASEHKYTKPPFVVTICGLAFSEIGIGFELRHIQELLDYLFPGRRGVSEADIQKAVLADSEDFRYHIVPNPTPPKYLETAMRGAATLHGLNVVVMPFDWSRDPENTVEFVQQFKANLLAMYSKSKAQERPFYVIAHSWGSVIAHQALTELAEEGYDIKVERFVTLGSPLIPSGILQKLFVTVEIIKENLQLYVHKPANVVYWSNLWAAFDTNSGPIKVADKNTQVDIKAVSLVKKLENVLDAANKEIIKADLLRLTHRATWHDSYYRSVDIPVQYQNSEYKDAILERTLYEYFPR